jgi:hypothetical protein
MNPSGHKRDAWHRSLGENELPAITAPATMAALELAQQRAKECHDHQRLLDPREALVVACRDRRGTETLYSIAHHAAQTTGGDADIVLRHLEYHWPDFA